MLRVSNNDGAPESRVASFSQLTDRGRTAGRLRMYQLSCLLLNFSGALLFNFGDDASSRTQSPAQRRPHSACRAPVWRSIVPDLTVPESVRIRNLHRPSR